MCERETGLTNGVNRLYCLKFVQRVSTASMGLLCLFIVARVQGDLFLLQLCFLTGKGSPPGSRLFGPWGPVAPQPKIVCHVPPFRVVGKTRSVPVFPFGFGRVLRWSSFCRCFSEAIICPMCLDMQFVNTRGVKLEGGHVPGRLSGVKKVS